MTWSHAILRCGCWTGLQGILATVLLLHSAFAEEATPMTGPHFALIANHGLNLEPHRCSFADEAGLVRIENLLQTVHKDTQGELVTFAAGNTFVPRRLLEKFEADARDYYLDKANVLAEGLVDCGARAVCLSADDFALGAAELQSLSRRLRLPFVCANVVRAADDRPVVSTSHVHECDDGARVLVVSVTQAASNQAFPEELKVVDAAASLKKVLDAHPLRNGPVMLIAHADLETCKSLSRLLPDGAVLIRVPPDVSTDKLLSSQLWSDRILFIQADVFGAPLDFISPAGSLSSRWRTLLESSRKLALEQPVEEKGPEQSATQVSQAPADEISVIRDAGGWKRIYLHSEFEPGHEQHSSLASHIGRFNSRWGQSDAEPNVARADDEPRRIRQMMGLYCTLQEWGAVRRAYDRLVELNATDYDLRCDNLVALFNLGDQERAIAEAKAMLIATDAAGFFRDPFIWSESASANLSAILDLVAKWCETMPEDRDAQLIAARLHYHQVGKDRHAILAHLTRAIELKNDEPRAWYWRARVHQEKDNIDAALDDLGKAIAVDGSLVDARILRAELLLLGAKKDTDMAEQDLATAMREGQPDWRTWALVGQVAGRREEWKLADSYYRVADGRAVAESGTGNVLYHQLLNWNAVAADRLGDPLRAAQLFEQAGQAVKEGGHSCDCAFDTRLAAAVAFHLAGRRDDQARVTISLAEPFGTQASEALLRGYLAFLLTGTSSDHLNAAARMIDLVADPTAGVRAVRAAISFRIATSSESPDVPLLQETRKQLESVLAELKDEARILPAAFYVLTLAKTGEHKQAQIALDELAKLLQLPKLVESPADDLIWGERAALRLFAKEAEAAVTAVK